MYFGWPHPVFVFYIRDSLYNNFVILLIEKANVEDIITGYETKLSNARNTIRDELNEGLAPFESDLDDLHATYLSTFMLYLKNCYDENSSEYTTKVADYQDELAALKTQAVADFNTAVDAAITRIETFHGQIITQ